MIWHDVPGFFISEGSGSTTDPVYRLHAYAEAQDGRRLDWELETADGKTAQVRIDNTVYDLADGALFIITTKHGETGVKQLHRDLSGVQPNHESCVAFAESDPDVARFISDTLDSQSEPTATSTPVLSASTPAAGSPPPSPLAPHRPAVTQAQSLQGQGVWTNYQLPGESQGYVRDIVIDRDGRVWVANPGGVHVLDTDDSAGTSTWTTYTTADGLPNDWATALAIDEYGHIWVGTRDGIGVFDGTAWITYTGADGLVGSWVKTIAIDAIGQVWVGIDDKLARFDGQTLRAETQDGAWETIQDAPTGITAIDFDLAGRVWVGHQQGISVLDGTNWTHYTAANEFLMHFVNDVTISPDDNVWVSNGICLFHSQDCTNAGLSQFDGQSWINHRATYAHNNNSGDLVYEIAVDEAGNIWVGVASGIIRFDGQNWVTYTQADGLAPDTGYGGNVYALAIDSMGRKWLGTQTALTRFDDTPGAEMAPSPPQPHVEISAGPGDAHSRVVQVGTEITLIGVPVAIGMPHYTLYLDSQPALTVTYNGQITYQQFPDTPVAFISTSASSSRVEFTLEVVHPGTVELSIGATGEVRLDYGDGSGAWSWGGAASESIAILAVKTADSVVKTPFSSRQTR